MSPSHMIHTDGTRYRDLNGNGILDPYEDARLPVSARVEDLISRLSLNEKAALMMHSIVNVTADGRLDGPALMPGRAGAVELISGRSITHLNVHGIPDPRSMARWSNEVQRLAEHTGHGIPVTISTDPRHSFTENWGASFTAGHLSAWPEPIGLGALGDVDVVREFAQIARREYVALGIRSALHPTLDVSTEPRWARQYSTFGQDADLVARLGIAYVEGFEGEAGLGRESVACMAKHFPGGGPQRDGEDPHFPYGREQDYLGGMFEYHLEPFRKVVARGVSAIMPSYGIPIGLELGGEHIEEVAFGFNRQMLTGLLRERLGFDGVICTDWSLITESRIGNAHLPARAWGLEHLSELDRVARAIEAGCDQFGGEQQPDWIVELVQAGRLSEQRIDASVRRLLTVKFELGLFEDPYVDEDAAAEIVGSDEFRAAGYRAQVASATVVTDIGQTPILPIRAGITVHSPEIPDDAIEDAGFAVSAAPEGADVIVTRVSTPFDPRDTYMLEPAFHAGSLEFPHDEIERIRALATHAPVVVVIHLERPAILEPLLPHLTAVLAVYGSSDKAVLEALSTDRAAKGGLPFDLPRSVAAIRASRSDVPGDSVNPLFRADVRHSGV